MIAGEFRQGFYSGNGLSGAFLCERGGIMDESSVGEGDGGDEQGLAGWRSGESENGGGIIWMK